LTATAPGTIATDGGGGCPRSDLPATRAKRCPRLWGPTPEQPARRPATYTAYLDPHALAGKRLGVLVPYIGKGTPDLGVGDPIDPEVAALFEQARADLEAEAATLIEVTPPAHTIWFVDQPNNTARWASLGFPPDFLSFE
jgi:Asp-tRNA(Asn)/Glu-tRNA(Gln) amidotransferase A subunit family amidase